MKLTRQCPRLRTAFTLMEVMIAIFIFFICIFGILELMSQSLKTARLLQKPRVDIGSLAAELTLTNKLEEGTAAGDFGDLYPNCSWSRNITQVSSNGLFQIDFTVVEMAGGNPVESKLSVLMYKPDSVAQLGLPIQRRR